MAKKTVGYVELEWSCKRCGTRNPGTQKVCSNCGAAMSEQDQFELPAQQELITDKEKLEQAKKGPDIICPYCGTRNPAGAESCAQCSGGLKEGKAREQGQVLGALSTAPVPEENCPFCGTPNPVNAQRCKHCNGSLVKTPAAPPQPAQPPSSGSAAKKVGLGLCGAVAVGFLVLACIIFLVLSMRTEAITAEVQSVHWERSIAILEERPVKHEDWEDSIPAGADKGSCQEKLRETVSEPVAGANEVCGTPYTVDKGSGVGEVVQDCEYEVYDSWCSYTQLEWTVTDTEIAQGDDLNPFWPVVSLSNVQREGDRVEEFTVTFWSDSKNETYTMSVSDAGSFAQYLPGSEWDLKVNTFGHVSEAQRK